MRNNGSTPIEPGEASNISEAEIRQRQEWNGGILDFHKRSRGALETWVIEAERLPTIIAGAMAGVPAAKSIIDTISEWMKVAARQPASSPALCLNCDVAFHPPDIMPAVFVVHLAFSDPRAAMMNGVCERCARNGGDWHARSLQLLRQVFPDAYRVEYPSSAQ